MISKQEVERIAKLARLELTEKEIVKMQKDLSLILNYFDVLKSAPKKNMGAQAEKRRNELRTDEPRKSQISDEIMGGVPDKKNDYIKVKSIF